MAPPPPPPEAEQDDNYDLHPEEQPTADDNYDLHPAEEQDEMYESPPVDVSGWITNFFSCYSTIELTQMFNNLFEVK